MALSCPVRAPEERKASDIVQSAQLAMMEKVHAAVASATAQAREQFAAAGLDMSPAQKEYFEAVVHQRMYLALCGADTTTFKGGDVRKAVKVIRNQQSIANHYWSAGIEITPEA